MTPQFLCSLKPVCTQFTLYDFLGAGHDWLGKHFLNREFQLIGSKSFFLFIKVNFYNDHFSIYVHLFCGNLPGVALNFTQCELVLDPVK